ncbi:MAG: UDP-N-acetylmuramate--L-alanine ligase [Deltaproteobacteria bacterium]|nr:UDP-N-acetylmuramate--L-alanine ligase [Deltaproteobacteria bacterium]
MLKSRLKEPVHFIGIGGSGMSGLAEMAVHLGISVQGTDIKSSTIIDRLVTKGVRFYLGHSGQSLDGAGTVVYSSAIAADNPELTLAHSKAIEVLHRSDFLQLLMSESLPITVAGTHGKSTTSAMIAHVLDDLGCKPKAVIGAEMIRYDSYLLLGDGNIFVAEADESDGSFLKYRPYVGVITNVELDHLDFFKNQGALLQAFGSYLQNITEDGFAIIGWDHPLTRDVGSTYLRDRLTYGFVLGCDVRARDYISVSGSSTFTVIVERDVFKCSLPMMGKHNVQNALCALAVTRSLGLNVKDAAASLANFRGVKRRMDRLLSTDRLKIYDDYAHNPGKISACIQALRQTWPQIKLHVVYQPHRFTRLETMYDEMLQSLDGADLVYVLPVYSAGETTQLDFSPAKIAADLRLRMDIDAVACDTLDEAVTTVQRQISDKAIVLTIGAGDVWRVAAKLKENLA